MNSPDSKNESTTKNATVWLDPAPQQLFWLIGLVLVAALAGAYWMQPRPGDVLIKVLENQKKLDDITAQIIEQNNVKLTEIQRQISVENTGKLDEIQRQITQLIDRQ